MRAKRLKWKLSTCDTGGDADDQHPTHIFPLCQMPDMEHPPGEQLSRSFYEPECWCCREGICQQVVTTERYPDGFHVYVKVLHGTAPRA